jgi:hypothetical protein
MKNQVKLEKKVMEFANTMNAKGYDLKDVMMELFHRALLIFSAEEGHETAMIGFENGKLAVTTAMPGYEIGLRPALGNRMADPGAMIVVGDLDKGETRVEMPVQTVITALQRDPDLVGVIFRANSADFQPVEADSELSAPSEAGTRTRVSDAPLDRDEVLAWIDMKISGANKSGMEEARGVLVALRGEIAQHLEAAPIDFETALRGFYADVYGRNLKAGWWSDLATGDPKKRSVGELFMLFVTEIAEAYTAYLTNAADDKLPQYPGLGVELADVQIRLADFCGALLAGNIVEFSGVDNPGDAMFTEIVEIASRYEAIRKTPKAKGQAEIGGLLPVGDVAEMVTAKLAFNATRADHKIENRQAEGGKVT